MKKTILTICCTVTLSMLLHKSFAQKTELTQKIITADSIATGNFKDVFTSFYQLALSNLTGSNKELNFTSNPYAIMLKSNPKLSNYNDYYRYRMLRKLNFSVNAKLDSNSHFNGFATGLNFAIINNRDYTTNELFLVQANQNKFYGRLLDVLAIERNKLPNGSAFNTLVGNQMQKLSTDSTFTFNQLDSTVKSWMFSIKDSVIDTLKSLVKRDNKIILFKEKNKQYDSVVNIYAKRLLWKVGVSDTSYSSGKLFKAVQLNTELLKGITKPSGAVQLELNLKATVNYIDDSMQTGKKLDRQVFNFEPGINLVFKGKNNQKSYLEFKVSGSYTNVWKGLRVAEDKITNTLVGTLRIRVIDDLWIPLEIKYDPANGNVFGFLSAKFNFTGLGKLLNGGAK